MGDPVSSRTRLSSSAAARSCLVTPNPGPRECPVWVCSLEAIGLHFLGGVCVPVSSQNSLPVKVQTKHHSPGPRESSVACECWEPWEVAGDLGRLPGEVLAATSARSLVTQDQVCEDPAALWAPPAFPPPVLPTLSVIMVTTVAVPAWTLPPSGQAGSHS